MTIEEIRDEIATKAGITAAALRGDTRDELEAHAKELAALLPEPKELTAAEIVDRATGGAGDPEADAIVAQATGQGQAAGSSDGLTAAEIVARATA